MYARTRKAQPDASRHAARRDESRLRASSRLSKRPYFLPWQQTRLACSSIATPADDTIDRFASELDDH
jgi:hypothetical protein